MSLTKIRADLIDFSQSISNTVNLTANLVLSNTSALVANGSSGTSGNILYSNGTATYWSTNPSTTAAKTIALSIVFGG